MTAPVPAWLAMRSAPGIAAAGHVGQAVLVKACILQGLRHAAFHLWGRIADQATEVTALDLPDGAKEIAEFLIEQAVKVAAHGHFDDIRRAGQGCVSLVERVELLLNQVELFEKRVELVSLDPEILQHLLQLANFLGDVACVDSRNTLGRYGVTQPTARKWQR